MEYRTHIHRTDAELAELECTWEGLRKDSRSTHIRHRPDWLGIQARTGGGSSDPKSIRAGSSILVASVSVGDRLVGLAPFLVHHWRWRFRAGYLSLGEFPVRRAVLCGDALLAPEEHEAQRALLRAIAADPAYSVMFMEAIPVQSMLWALVQSAPELRDAFWIEPSATTPHRVARLPATFEEYLSKFSSRTRQTLRYKVRKLEKACEGRMQIDRITKRGELATYLERAERVSERSWQGMRLGYVIRASVHRDRLAAYADAGWLRSYVLRRGDEPIAIVTGIQADGVFYYEQPAYDPAWAAYTPGTVLLFRLIEDLCTHDRASVLDFGSGDSEYKRLFSTGVRDTVNALLVRRSASLAVPYALHRACTTGTQLVRKTLDRFELRERVRHLLRGGPQPPKLAGA